MLMLLNLSVPDRPLMDSERPLQLHNQWSQNYRFELRHKPTVIIMVSFACNIIMALMLRIKVHDLFNQ